MLHMIYNHIIIMKYDLFLLQLESSVVVISNMKPHVSLDVPSVAFFKFTK